VLGSLSAPGSTFGIVALALLLAGIGAAMLLLGAAALPGTVARDQRIAGLVADRRLELALAGTATLLFVTVAYLFAVS
jgi:hypothetical protein